ncbi:hypothetical protein BDQ94DRAFT_469 [Aspergillus welwitschiae]|uniref:Uncharacterized protein n=1 Tax=Aspergillus welwitschiae TaxID=1341132 RepID=A0A3F3QIM9_9EURO|nr:hypothetical protein BDQ94DRAFT_469 [Aspergillus welwitschiae]RDH38977.1 hypothetical protein BDQ94DRAFT_469 [Aspergillus welwitschiae]
MVYVLSLLRTCLSNSPLLFLSLFFFPPCAFSIVIKTVVIVVVIPFSFYIHMFSLLAALYQLVAAQLLRLLLPPWFPLELDRHYKHIICTIMALLHGLDMCIS